MKTLTEKAYAKLNLSLDVVSRLDSGYHGMRMVMQSVSLCDDVTICVKEGSGVIHVHTNRFYLPVGEDNLAGKAAKAFLRRIENSKFDVDISIRKRIPVCAGLGGGSSDAAAVLRGLNRLLNAGLTLSELEELGLQIGSDVPYCIAGGTALAEGRGEQLTALSHLSCEDVVICKPRFSVSTPELFRKIDGIALTVRPDTEGIVQAVNEGRFSDAARRVLNVFEQVPARGSGEIAHIRKTMTDHGALGAAMSGTGSAVFGLFDSPEKAKTAFQELRARYRECFLCRTTERLRL